MKKVTMIGVITLLIIVNITQVNARWPVEGWDFDVIEVSYPSTIIQGNSLSVTVRIRNTINSR